MVPPPPLAWPADAARPGAARQPEVPVQGLVVRFDLRDEGAAAEFDALVGRTLPAIVAEEPGTLQYAVHAVADEPLARVFYEVYADAEAFAAHEAAPHTRAMLDAFEPLLDRTPRVEHFPAVAGKGLPGA